MSYPARAEGLGKYDYQKTKNKRWLEFLEIAGRMETICSWNRVEYWEESWRTEETCCFSYSKENLQVYTGVKKSQAVVDTVNTINERMTTSRKRKWEEKQLYGRFKRLINNISHQKTWTWLRKGNLKRKSESLLIAAQDNATRTNHIKARIDKTQQNSNVGYAVTETKRSITW